jgi:hypothetical protein
VDLVDNEAAGSVSQTDTAENQSRLSDKVKTTAARNGSFIDDEDVAQNTDDEIQALSFHRHRTAASLSPVPAPRPAVYKRRVLHFGALAGGFAAATEGTPEQTQLRHPTRICLPTP